MIKISSEVKEDVEELKRKKKFKRQRPAVNPDTKKKVSEQNLKKLELEELLLFEKQELELKENPYFKVTKEHIERAKISENSKDGLRLFLYRAFTQPQKKLVNTIITTSLPKPLDVELLISNLKKNVLDYRKFPKFSGIPVRLSYEGTKYTVSFFKSGKINIAGLPSIDNTQIEKVSKTLSNHANFFEGGENYSFIKNIKPSDFLIRNRVYSLKIPVLAKLKSLQKFNSLEWRHVKYNDQTFPGGVYVPFIKKSKDLPLHIQKPELDPIFQDYKDNNEKSNTKVIFFRTGSCIVVGVTSLESFFVTVCKFIFLMIKYHQEEKEYPL